MIPKRFSAIESRGGSAFGGQTLVQILLFLSLSGCSVALETPSIYSEIPQGKTTASSSRFELIDDFNAGIEKTKFGTEWQVSGNSVRLRADREDAIRHGGGMAIQYELKANQTVDVFASLKGHDSSQAEYLVFLIRKADLDTFPGKIKVSLKDLTGKEGIFEINKSKTPLWKGPKGDWSEVAIPKSAFKGLDFNQLDSLKLTFITSKETAAHITIDEVAFFGPEKLVFNSDRDNLVGFSEEKLNEVRRQELLNIKDDQEFLQAVAKDTWLYFERAIDQKTRLVVDHIRVGDAPGIGSYVTPTNIGLYWIANVAAFDLSLISREEAVRNIESSLTSFESLDRWEKGFWYNYYHTGTKQVTRPYVSAVDNGWLAAGLIVIRQAFPELSEMATEILISLDFSKFYDAFNGQMKLGYEADKELYSRFHYGLLVTEARLASYIAIGKGDLENEHWARIYRTLPPEWDWQKQIPEGAEVTLFETPVFEGHYTHLGKKFVPSWGGSLFEFLSPALLIKEQELAPEGLGKNNLVATDLHIEHAKSRNYPVWGMAPCAVRNGKYWIYREYGVTDLGAKGYPDRGVMTPYAVFLALETRPEAAIQNLREMLKQYPDIYGEYGFYDSVDAVKGIVNYQYLVLDQGMSFLAIANYLKDGVIQKYFHADPIGKKGEVLLTEERFSI